MKLLANTHIDISVSKRAAFFQAVLLLLWGMGPSCSTDLDELNKVEKKQDMPLQRAEEMTILYTDSGRLEMELYAPVLERYLENEESIIVFPEGIKAVFYGRTGEVESKLTADKAKYFESRDMWEAKNNVVAVNEAEGRQLNTDYLIWDERKAIIYTNRKSKVTTPEEILYGEGFEADQSFSRFTFRHVTGIVSVDQEKEKPEENELTE